ncbi:MAG: ATP-binding protein [Thaumarchaeota archaeon]|nr:ATP-binding protein [Nitrososphaerota archaeon]
MTENPFVFGTIVRGDNFADRKKEVKEIASDLTSKTNLIIFSPRRYGKTSLIFKVLEDLEKKSIICAYVDLYPATTIEKFANIYASSMAKSKGGKLDEIINFIKDLIPPVKLTVRPEGTSDIEGGMEIELSRGKSDINAVLSRLYDLPERIATKKRKKMVVVFDEFQEITKIDGQEIERSLRSRIQHHKNVSYVFMGSQMHLLGRAFESKDRALYRMGKPFNLRRIPPEEFGIFIKDRFRVGGMTISAGNVAKIVDLTQCHPYYTQQLCHEVWNYRKSLGTKSVETDDITVAKEQLMRNQNYAYTALWDSIKGKQRAVLLAMAKTGQKEIFASDFREDNGLGAPSTIARAAQYLEEKGLIEKNGSQYGISDTFFEEWLKRLD